MHGIAQPHDHPPLVLASTSIYRRELLQRLRLAFSVRRPQTDEAQLPGEAPRDMALRLAQAKASAVARVEPGAWIIGSDQVCACEGRVLGKPGSHDAAAAQLRLLRGRESVFYTAIALVAPDGRMQVQEVPTRVRMRQLTDMQIEAYLRADQPYDCAGSAKSESLGIALVEAISSDDPTAIVGLPLIALCNMLLAAGFPVLGSAA
ncbi:MAG: septum formation protein Maf [Betaproteobacteria bacterium]|nr:septum formation protein Maf [Betaproteobacteria bacterium]